MEPHLHIFQFFPQLRQQVGIGLALHITQRHIGVGAVVQLHPLQRQAGVADAAAQQGRVLHQVLHEAVVAAAEDAAGVRLLNGAGGELLDIHEDAAAEAVHHQKGPAGEHAQHRLLPAAADGGVAGGDAAAEKRVQRGDGRQIRQGQPLGDHAL